MKNDNSLEKYLIGAGILSLGMGVWMYVMNSKTNALIANLSHHIKNVESQFVNPKIKEAERRGRRSERKKLRKKKKFTSYPAPGLAKVSSPMAGSLDQVASWNSYYLTVDLGATNVRIAFYNAEPGFNPAGNVVYHPKFECHNMTTFISELNTIYAKIQKKAKAACLALAGPILGDTVTITNYDPTDRVLRKSDLPLEMVDMERTYFLNDLESCCYGILATGDEGKLPEYFKGPEKELMHLPNHHFAVLAMGTGLGTGLIVSINDPADTSKPQFRVVPLELGHCIVKTDQDKHIKRRMEYFSKKVYDSQYYPEYEEICSGRGLELCYDYETLTDREEKPLLDAGEIAKRAIENSDEDAVAAMMIHYRFLYRAAQEIGIMIPRCQGVFLAGDNQVHNEPFLEKHLECIQTEFYDNHPKSDWLESMNIFRQYKRLNLNLKGAHFYIEAKERQQLDWDNLVLTTDGDMSTDDDST